MPLLSVMLSDQEYEYVLEVMREGGYPSHANVLRSALWHLVTHFDHRPPKGCFDQRLKELPESIKELS